MYIFNFSILTFSPTLRFGENEFCENEVEAKLYFKKLVFFYTTLRRIP